MSVSIYDQETQSTTTIASKTGLPTLDAQPTEGSSNPITSDWAYSYKASIDKKISDIETEIKANKQGTVTTVPLASFTGNLTKIVTSVIDGPDGTITYAVKSGLCHINFSFAIAGKAVTLRTDEKTTDVSNALWIISSVKLPKPLQMARGQAVPVNSSETGTANLKVEEDGTLQLLINNYNSSAGQWYQGGMSYIINENEEETAEG